MICKQLIKLLMLTMVLSMSAVSAKDSVHVRLQDRLDRPMDGYCFDILGTGQNLRLDLPLFAHNCKLGATADSTLVWTEEGQLFFPAVGMCVTAFGVNNRALANVPVLLQPCGAKEAFFSTALLQAFEHQENGQIQLRDHDLCIVVGGESASTYSSADRWRALFLGRCTDAEASHSAWELVPLD